MDLRGKHVLVLGLGKSGLAAARLLVRAGARVSVSEQAASAGLEERRAALAREGVAVELGGHGRLFAAPADVAVVSPGIPWSSGPVGSLLARRIPIWGELELASRFHRGPIVAVTGTNGKSTVTTWTARMLQQAGFEACACGNLGFPFSEAVLALPLGAWAVVEASSFQLHACVSFHPQVVVFLNLTPDHLAWHGSLDAYLDAKWKIFEHQTPDDVAVLPLEDGRLEGRIRRLNARVVRFGRGDVDENPNKEAVWAAGTAIGLSDSFVREFLASAQPLEHRLEDVPNGLGLRIVNDSKSTNPDSLRWALARLGGPRALLLAGGRVKEADYVALSGDLARLTCGAVLYGEGRFKLEEAWRGACDTLCVETLAEALDRALAWPAPLAVVLFSPGCASFDQFENFEHRGRHFKSLVAARETCRTKAR